MTFEKRWDGSAAEMALGDDPSRRQINALFAIPGPTKSESSLPHHAVSADGTVGAPDKDGCIAGIGALNGSRGGVSATTAEKNTAYSHLASHLRGMGVDPPAKQFGGPAAPGLELRMQRRSAMLRVPERIALNLGAAGVEMRAKPNGTGSGPDKFHFTGYATVYDYAFEMWDFWGDKFSEKVAQGAGARTLANNCDVPFLVGHNDAGIPMARTKSGTMSLGEDSHGLWADAPDLDGRNDEVRRLASAVERGDADEMSMAFMTLRQDWSPDYEERTILEYDLHKGDVSVVVFGANDATAGATMSMPPELLTARRPTGIWQKGAGQFRALPGMSQAPDYDPQPVSRSHEPAGGTHTHPHEDGDGTVHSHPHTHDGDAAHGHAHYYDAAGAAKVDAGPLYDEDGVIKVDAGGVPEEMEGDAAQGLARRARELELLKLTA